MEIKAQRKKKCKKSYFPFTLSPSDLPVLNSYMFFWVFVSQVWKRKTLAFLMLRTLFFSRFWYLLTKHVLRLKQEKQIEVHCIMFLLK